MVKQVVSTYWAEEVFDIEVVYVSGIENILSDVLSCLYSNDEPETVCVRSKYTYHNVVSNDVLSTHALSMCILGGREGDAMFIRKIMST